MTEEHPQTREHQPVVSVLMPVYNAAPYLRESVGSICNQSFTEFELIAVDDGSTDESLAILKELAGEDSRIRYISRPNTGIVGALNDGLELVQTNLVARMDADDIAHSDRLQKQYSFMQEHSDCVVLGCRCIVVDNDGDPLWWWGYEIGHENIMNRLMAASVGDAIIHSSVMIRTEALRESGSYRNDGGLSEDLELYFRLAELGKLENLPDTLMTIRQTGNSLTSGQSQAEQAKSKETVINRERIRRGLPGDFKIPESQYDTLPSLSLSYSIAAHSNGFYPTARKHARRAIIERPASALAWYALLISTPVVKALIAAALLPFGKGPYAKKNLHSLRPG